MVKCKHCHEEFENAGNTRPVRHDCRAARPPKTVRIRADDLEALDNTPKPEGVATRTQMMTLAIAIFRDVIAGRMVGPDDLETMLSERMIVKNGTQTKS
jgi:hypothetical protein